jgi:predicted RNA-binding protein with PUA-like domain
MAYWLVKTEPGEFSFEDLLRDGSTVWDGVRNFQARNNLAHMTLGDSVFVYHSVTEKALAGLAQVSRAAYPDPTDNPDGRWVVVDLVPVRPLARRISLAELKSHPTLNTLPLIKQSRLSVMPLTEAEFQGLLALEGAG